VRIYSKAAWRAYLAGCASTALERLYPARQGLERSYAPVEISSSPTAQSPAPSGGAVPTLGQGSDAVVAVNNSMRFQTVEGFGAAHNTLARGPTKDALSPQLHAEAIEAV